ncbi:MAG: hypothetical protein GX630_10080 [Actinobacteria bacterium]|nr:hypothetical protein [Actinomycetota bacterium]
MKLTYDEIAQWVDEYFAEFEKYGQDPENIHRMDAYFSKDVVYNPYIALVGEVSGRDNWYRVLLSHPSGVERLTPEDVVIDERRQIFAARIKSEIVDRDTQKILVTKRYFVSYPLVEEEGRMKIARLDFFWEVLAPGAMEIDDVFERDWKKNPDGPQRIQG